MADTQPTPKSKGSFERFVHDHVGLSILLAVALGLALLVGSLFLLEHLCACAHAPLTCAMVAASPPWVPLATVLAAPITTLGIYLKTTHKKHEIAQKERDQEQKDKDIAAKDRELAAKDEEIAAERRSAQRQRLASASSEVASAVVAAYSERAIVAAAVGDLERIGRSDDMAADAAESIAAFLRAVEDPLLHKNANHETAGQESDEITRLRQRCVAALKTIRIAHPTVPLDLRGATLLELDMRGMDLRHADLRHADLYRADLRGCAFEEAQLVGARARDAILDWLPNEEHTSQYIFLISSGAYMLKDGRRTDGSGRVVED